MPLVVKNVSGKQKTLQTQEFTKALGLPMSTFAAATYCFRFPMLSLCNKHCKKNITDRKQTIQHSIYAPKTAHFMPWLTSALVTWIAVLNKVSRQERKLEESKSVRYIFFWRCFRQDLNLNFQSPSFSAVVPAVVPPFSAVFCPLNFLFFQFFPGLPVFFSWQQFFCIHFRCLVERCCKCTNVTNNSSKTALCEQWQSRKQIRRNLCPPVLGDVTLSSNYWDLELDLPRLCVRIEIKTMSAVFRCHVPILEQFRTEKKEKQGLHKKRLRKQQMPQNSKKIPSDQLEAPQTLRGVLFFAVWFF